MSTQHLWGVQAIALGAWELVAFATGRVPTISCTVRRVARGREAATTAAVLCWSLALARHLTHQVEESS